MKKIWSTVYKVIICFPRVLKLTWEANPRYTLLGLLLTIVTSMVLPAQILMSKIVIDRVTRSALPPDVATNVDWYELLTPIGVTFIVWLSGGICQSVTNSLRELLAFQTQNHINYLILKKAAEMDLAFYESSEFFDQMENARQKNWLASHIVYYCIESLGALFSLGAMLALLSRLHPLTVVILLFTSVPHIIVASYYGGRRFRLITSRAPSQRMVNYLSNLLGSRETVKEIRLFELHDFLLKKFRSYSQAFFIENRHLMFSWERSALGLRILSLAGTVGIWAYTAIRAASRRITIGDLALVFQAAEMSREKLNYLFQMGGLFYEHSLYLGNLFSFLDLAPDSVDGALSQSKRAGKDGPILTQPLEGGIEFCNVSFRYPQSDRLVLQNLSFHIRDGERVALVGENGAGKTTLVKLLARFYDPTEGVIYLNGKDLREYDVDDLRRRIGIIFQDFVRYNLPLRENIGFGKIEVVNDDERVIGAAHKGGAYPIIQRLPHGMNTILGKVFEDSVDLSGGEWQKLALSRAFMRDAEILILDEPTAALDAFAEHEVYSKFASLTENRTTILISHRFSTVRIARHILVLQNGRLIEEGNHQDLMTFNGQYALMYNTQADRYR